MTKEEFVMRAKEILEMKLKAELLRKDLGIDYDHYFVEKAEFALKCLEETK